VLTDSVGGSIAGYSRTGRCVRPTDSGGAVASSDAAIVQARGRRMLSSAQRHRPYDGRYSGPRASNLHEETGTSAAGSPEVTTLSPGLDTGHDLHATLGPDAGHDTCGRCAFAVLQPRIRTRPRNRESGPRAGTMSRVGPSRSNVSSTFANAPGSSHLARWFSGPQRAGSASVARVGVDARIRRHTLRRRTCAPPPAEP